jgi:hypothetical protein
LIGKPVSQRQCFQYLSRESIQYPISLAYARYFFAQCECSFCTW